MLTVQELKKKLGRGGLSLSQREQIELREQRGVLRNLPEDFTGHVFTAVRQRADEVKGELQAIDEALQELEPQITAVRAEVNLACAPVIESPRITGDILSEYELQPALPSPNRFVVTEKSLGIRTKKLVPLLNKKEWLVLRKNSLQTELIRLKQTALMASCGDVALLHHLSSQLKAKLVLWGMELPHEEKKVVVTDAAGFELPKEALGIDGMPDHPLSGVAPTEMISKLSE